MKNVTQWSIDPVHSEIAFQVKHLMISNVKGIFREFGVTVQSDGNDFNGASIDFWMNPASVDTGEKKRDDHLKSPDFFDVDKYRKITFTSDSFEKSGDNNHFNLVGKLTIRGISKQIKLDVEFGGIMKDPYGNEKAGFTITGLVNRKDWGLDWNTVLEMGGVLVGDDVKISCEVELVKHL